jgi:hypothetical protein
VEWFTDPECHVSYNRLYLDDGSVVQITPTMECAAWHAGVCIDAIANRHYYGLAAATDTRTPVNEGAVRVDRARLRGAVRAERLDDRRVRSSSASSATRIRRSRRDGRSIRRACTRIDRSCRPRPVRDGRCSADRGACRVKMWHAVVAGAVLLGAIGVLASVATSRKRALDDAKITLAGLSALDSADKAETKRLLQRLAAADSARRADSVKFAAAVTRLGSQLSDALVLARTAGKARTDTVTVTVGVLEDASNAVNACVMADNSCERNLAAERDARASSDRHAAEARAREKAARQLIPTRGQQLWHDTKVVAATGGTIWAVRSILKMITGMIGQ